MVASSHPSPSQGADGATSNFIATDRMFRRRRNLARQDALDPHRNNQEMIPWPAITYISGI